MSESTGPPGPEACCGEPLSERRRPEARVNVPSVILDTNVVIAASFRPRSDSGRIVEGVRNGELHMIWCESTRRETERLCRRIPPISWSTIEGLFSDAGFHGSDPDPTPFSWVEDPSDRKFAALAVESGATLLSLDRHLLNAPHDGRYMVCTPRDYLRHHPCCESCRTA